MFLDDVGFKDADLAFWAFADEVEAVLAVCFVFAGLPLFLEVFAVGSGDGCGVGSCRGGVGSRIPVPCERAIVARVELCRILAAVASTVPSSSDWITLL